MTLFGPGDEHTWESTQDLRQGAIATLVDLLCSDDGDDGWRLPGGLGVAARDGDQLFLKGEEIREGLLFEGVHRFACHGGGSEPEQGCDHDGRRLPSARNGA